jgi:hypothetical protein
MRWNWGGAASAVVVLMFGASGMAHAQYVRACGGASPLSSQGAVSSTGSTVQPSRGVGQLELIPSICVAERYDSNVFFSPRTAGLKRDDFVTNINPMLRVNYNGGLADGFLEVGGFGETYVRNPTLNYIGTADTLSLDLDKSIKRLLPNASLSITNSVRYTPTPPGFVNPVAGTSPSSPGNIQNVFAQGILSYRANNLTNNGTVTTSYATSPTTSLNASYSHAILRFGSSPISSASQLSLFDTTTQTGTVGGIARLNALDTVNVRYSHSQSEFIPLSGSASSTLFKTDSATLGWSRILTPYLTAEVGGGGILIDPGITTYAANASLTMNLPGHRATISYSRSTTPSFIGAGVILRSDNILLTAVHNITQQWQLVESANYSHSTGGSGSSAVNYNTYAASVDLYYWVTHIWSTALSFDYMNFDQGFAGTKTTFDRYAITFGVKASWN